jgi:hypothetical protein
MSKIKMSFSLIIALLLVGIMSTAAFARAAYSTSVAADGSGGFTFSFNKISTDTATTFTLNVYTQGSTQGVYDQPFKTYTVSNVTDTSKQTVNVPASDGVQVGTVYKFELSNPTGVVGEKFGVLTDSANLSMASVADDSKLLAATGKGLDVNGTGLFNSNHTGQDAVRKNNVDGSKQSIHGAYQNNTNSCASCHQTHGAANGDSLLFKDGVYSTCSACHDGTTGAYNAFTPATQATASTVQGTFDVHAAGQNGSMHTADGSLNISAAPGGNNTPAAKTPYTQDFDCASCHAAHGAGSNEENNLNVDPMGWASVPYGVAGQPITYWSGHGNVTITATKDNQNGKLFLNIPIATRTQTGTDSKGNPTYNISTLTKQTPYILVKLTATTSEANNFWYKRAGVKAGDSVIQTYRWTDNGGYIPDYSLWLRDNGYPGTANTVLKQGTTDMNLNSALTVVWRDGFAFGAAVPLIDNANVALGIDVETTDDIATLWDGTIPDSGIEMSKYCTSCHVDYASNTRTNNTGVYTVAHRHATIGRDETTCVRCHYAHGTDAQIMHDANDNTYWDLTTALGATNKTSGKPGVGMTSDQALNYLTDPNPSSAIKRYTGMSVCYACHGGGEQFLGSPITNRPDVNTHQYLLGGQPGDDRTAQSK